MTMTNNEAELREQIRQYLYDEIESELDNDSMSKNVWLYLDNGSQKAIPWRDKAEQALLPFISDHTRKAKEELLEHLMTSNPAYTYEAAKDILIALKQPTVEEE